MISAHGWKVHLKRQGYSASVEAWTEDGMPLIAIDGRRGLDVADHFGEYEHLVDLLVERPHPVVDEDREGTFDLFV